MFCGASGVDEKAVAAALAALKKELSVPLLVDWGTGHDWGAAH